MNDSGGSLQEWRKCSDLQQNFLGSLAATFFWGRYTIGVMAHVSFVVFLLLFCTIVMVLDWKFYSNIKLCLYIHKSEMHIYNIGPCLHFNNEPVDTFWNVQRGWFCHLVKLTQRCPGSPKSSHSKVFSFGKLCFTNPAPFTSGIFAYICHVFSSNWVFQNLLSHRYSVFWLQPWQCFLWYRLDTIFCTI